MAVTQAFEGAHSTHPDHRPTSQDQSRVIRGVFGDAAEGYSVVGRLRALGFRIELAASAAGDLIVSVLAGPTQAEEVAALITTHEGRIEAESESSGH